MANCEINITNGVPEVQTYPTLMQDILVYSDFNLDQALDLYGIAISDEFQELNIQNPTLNNILSFNEQDNINLSSKLSKQDRQDMINISLQTQPIEDVKQTYIDAFNVKGEFGINIDQLTNSGLFTDSDILEMDNVETLNKLKNLYYKLNNTDEKFESITSDITVKDNLFSKLNPDEFTQSSHDFYIGAQSVNDIMDIASEVGDELIMDNPSLANNVLNIVQGKQSLIQYETDEYNGEIVRKAVNNTQLRLEQSFDTEQNFTSFLNQLDFIRQLPVEMYVTELPLVSRYFFNLERQARDLGFNVNGLSAIMEDKQHSEIIDLIDSIYNLILDAQEGNSDSIQESMEDFTQTYNQFFEVEPAFKTGVTNKIRGNGVYLHLETNRSEEDVFASNSIIKVKDNVYQKITDDNTIDDLYEILFQNPALIPNGVLSVAVKDLNRDIIFDDLDKYISDEANNYLTNVSDIETIKKIVAYKMLNNISFTQNEQMVNGLKNLDVNKFLISFNKTLLKNPTLENMFYFSNRGLESKVYIGEYTARQLQNELGENEFDNLVLYSKISGNESLDYLTNFNNDLTSGSKRDYYSNNLDQLPVFKGDTYFNNGYLVANSTEDFLRYKNELYEKVSDNVYANIKLDTRYKNYNLSKPTYDNSVVPNIKGSEAGKVKVSKTNKINDNTIEFC